MQASLDQIEAIALQTIARLPEAFRQAARSVVIRVHDLPDDAVIEELDLASPLELTGLYDGVPLPQKSAAEPDPHPDVVTLFRQPILAELAEREIVTLEELVAHVTIHEFAHHFGWSDDDIATVDRWWE